MGVEAGRGLVREWPPFARRRERTGDEGGAEPLTPEQRARIVRRLRWLARLMDEAVRIPGTRVAFGLDPVIGLAPGLGDALSLAVSAYIIHEAKRLGASRAVLRTMAINVLIDALVGTLPVVGDLADFAFKANRKNLELLGIWEEK